MSSDNTNEMAESGDKQKQEDIGDAEQPTTSKPEPDIFSEIDKRLGLLLDRANKLESTLNQLNGKCATDDQELDADLSDEVGDEEGFDDDTDIAATDNLDLDAADNVAQIDDVTDNLEKIYLDIQDD